MARACSLQSMDSDDDFGDFASVPAIVKDATLDSLWFGFSAPEIVSARPSTVEGVGLEKQPVTESNSDDDWGDFVEHSAPADRGGPIAFDSFAHTQYGFGQGPSFTVFTSVDEKRTLPISPDLKQSQLRGPSEVTGQHPQQKPRKVGFDGLSGAWNSLESETSLPEISASAGSDANHNNGMSERTSSGQEMETKERNCLKRNSLLPIPLSIFGDTELEESSKSDLGDCVAGPFPVQTSSKPVRDHLSSKGSKDLSNLIANLYTEAQPPSKAQNSDNVPNEPNEIVGRSKDLSSHQIIAADGNFELEKKILMLDLRLERDSNAALSKSDSCVTGGMERKSHDATSFALNSVSEADQCAFVDTWSSIMAICASELEFALELWTQAQVAGVQDALLADLKGKRYFAATGQLYAVALILAATLNVYKPWLQMGTKRGETLCADLERCKTVWLETNLKEGVCFALDGLEGWIPASVVSRKGIQNLSSIVVEAYKQAARASIKSLCKICLLPIDPFSCAGFQSVDWAGSRYLLPLANLWANRVSQKLPKIIFCS